MATVAATQMTLEGTLPLDCTGGFQSNAAAATFPLGIALPAGEGIVVNGSAGLWTETWAMGTLTPSATSITLFVAPRACTLLGIELIFTVAAGGTSTLTITHETGTQAPGAGTTTQTGSFNLNATGNTSQSATLAGGTVESLAVGDRLSTKFANAIQSTAGLTITLMFAPA
jgi:hypothetical protein